jgi:hypothetical protein
VLEAIEAFCQSHQYTINALTALGTLGAVVVSLWLARAADAANATRLSAYAEIMLIVEPGASVAAPRFIAIRVTNDGVFALRLSYSFFSWAAPFKRTRFMAQPIDDAGNAARPRLVPPRTYPADILPRHSETFFISEIGQFRDSFATFFFEASILERLPYYLLAPVITTDDGKEFSVRVGRSLRKELGQFRSRRPNNKKGAS